MKLILIIIPLSCLFIFCTAPQNKRTPKLSELESKPTVSTLVLSKIDSFAYRFPWLKKYTIENTLVNRISLPDSFVRIPTPPLSFSHWIRHLPLKNGNPPVLLYNGKQKHNQNVHAYIFDLDVGNRDLQQCADATMRIRAEYLFITKKYDSIHFNYTNGVNVPYSKWRAGYMPIPKGKKIVWTKNSKCDTSYHSFKQYLIQVFNYAGTYSLSKELKSIAYKNMQIGDIFIKGGFPGHAVMVVDIITNPVNGKKKYLLAQSYMPAQEFHILKNPNANTIWYSLDTTQTIIETPEWTFDSSQLKRF